MKLEEWFTVEDVARSLRLTRHAVYKRVQRGTLRAYLMGRALRFRSIDVRAALAERRARPR